jgi:CheY-like chemotaxis protein
MYLWKKHHILIYYYFRCHVLKVLIAEDEKDIATLYKMALEKRRHEVLVANNGEDCLKIYHEVSQHIRFNIFLAANSQQPFDAVILDYKMPKINGIEVAKEILAVNPHQRLIFATAYVEETFIDSIKELKQVVELMQKPFGECALIDIIEDKDVYERLQKFNVDIDIIKAINPTHEQIIDLLERLQRIQKHPYGQ